MLRKVFGIPSWLPDKEPDRTQRKERINRLFKQLNDLWHDVDILVIAQNWKDFKPIKTKNKQIIKSYKTLGLLEARKTLREEFLKLDYDYIIMLDDDCIIQCDNKNSHIKYMEIIDKHKDGFAFIHGNNTNNIKLTPYKSAQLNLCAISKFIYEKEPMVEVNPQKNEGYEDSIFSCLLHYKYSKYEFEFNSDITHIQWLNKTEYVPSTWSNKVSVQCNKMGSNTSKIELYISRHNELPRLDIFFEYGELINKNATEKEIDKAIEHYKRKNSTYMGRENTYLAF